MKRKMKRMTGLLLICTIAMTFLIGSSALQKTKASVEAAGVTDGYAAEVVRLVNIEREKVGLAPLSGGNSKLNAAAQKRAEELAVYGAHTRPNETGYQTIFPEYGITHSYFGENIAGGHANPDEVMYDQGWMDSPGHKANILSANYNKIGVGVYNHNGTLLWIQLFVYTTMPDDGGDPGTNPGTDPGTDPGTNPGTDPGTNPGTDPSNNNNNNNNPMPIFKGFEKVWTFIKTYLYPIWMWFLQFLRRLFLGIW